MLSLSQDILSGNPVSRSPPASSHLPDLAQIRYLYPQVRDKLPPRRALRCHERRTMGQHRREGDESDRRRCGSAIRRCLLRPRRDQGPGLPG